MWYNCSDSLMIVRKESKMTVSTQEFQVHVRYDGRSYEFSNTQLDLGDLSSDNDIKAKVAGHLNTPVDQFRNYVVDRHENGNVTLRPQAVFGG